MTAPTRYGGATFPSAGFSTTAGGSVDIGNNSDTVVIVRGGENASSIETLSGVTLNGVAMTALTAGANSGGGEVNTFVIDSASAIGSGSVTVTLSMSGSNAKPGLVVEVWHNCSGSPRYTTNAAATLGNASTQSHTVSSDVDAAVVLMGSVSGGITVVAASDTTLGASTAGASTNAGEFALYEAGAASVTLNWTHNFADTDYVQVVQVHGAAASTAATKTGGPTHSTLVQGRLAS